MPQFRKKPVTVSALQWTGDNFNDVRLFVGERTAIHMQGDGLLLTTLEDGPNGEAEHWATPGDWIIKGIKGEHYACKPDIFAATYEPAPEPVEPTAEEPPYPFCSHPEKCIAAGRCARMVNGERWSCAD